MQSYIWLEIVFCLCYHMMINLEEDHSLR